MPTKKNLYIITGAPGVGKTTLLHELSKSFNTICEPAREIIAEQREKNGNGLWEKDKELFAHLLLSKSISKFENVIENSITICDRGIPDNLAYAKYGNLDEVPFLKATQEYKYNKKVFLLKPWEEIYTTDDERDMPFKEVLKFHDCIISAYENYDLVEVPKLSINDRFTFIKNQISSF